MAKPAQEIVVRNFRVDIKDIVFIKAILESYEGMVVMRTVEIGKPVIELLIARDFAETVDHLVRDLASQLEMVEVEPSAPPDWL